MKRAIRFTTAILVLTMLWGMCASCAEPLQSEDTTAAASTEAPVEVESQTEVEETEFALSNIPD
ncbi:MAG: hypothetical protein IJF21_05475, partial [Clostridia bacterium]|nr:hypothetical protein [Clostridia bacterium]